MNRRNFITITTLATAGTLLTEAAFADHNGKIGTIDVDEWQKLNMQAGERLKAIKPTSTKLSDADQELMMEVAMGGMMQLAISKVAVAKATSSEVKMYAQAEVEEQTGLSAKLKEIAVAKGVSLPEAADEKTTKMVEKLNAKSGAEFDHDYLEGGGVEGHQKLEKTMNKVQSKADDATLKQVAMTAMPLIMTHLQAARDELKDVG